jgi:hypothetical protein
LLFLAYFKFFVIESALFVVVFFLLTLVID